MMAFIKRLLSCCAEKSIIEGRDPTLEEARAAMRAAEERVAIAIADQAYVARSVIAWARDTLTARDRAPTPHMMPRSIPIMAWLRGLTVAELTILKGSTDFEVGHHIYGDEKIHGLPSVRGDLPLAILRFPARIAPASDVERYAGGGGGPKRKLA